MPRLLIIEGCLKEQQEIGNKRRSAIVLTFSSENKGKRLTTSGLQFGGAIFFSSCSTSIHNPWGCDSLGLFTLQDFTWPYAPLFLPFLLCLAANSNCDFWVSAPEFIQEDFHFLGHFSEPIPTPLPLPFLFFLCLLFSKTFTVVPPLFVS